MSEGAPRRVPDFAALASVGVQGLRAYDPGLDIVALRRAWTVSPLAELGSNENAHGPSERARRAAMDSLADLHRYPDPLGGDLKRALSEATGVDRTGIVLGNGSHELLMMLSQVFAGPGRSVLASQFGFAVYALAAQAAAARYDQAPAFPSDSGMPRGHDLDALRLCVATDTALVYLANPNNPTGTWFDTAALSRWLESMPEDVIVVVDEAYLEFVTDPALVSAIGLLPRFPNLVVARTFSKAHGLAGLRVGYLCAHPGLVAMLERLRESFNVSLPGLAAAQAALADPGHVSRVRTENAAEREWLAGQLHDRGLAVGPSQTNFLLVDFGRSAAPIESALVARGVVPRPMAGYGLPGCLRITVGLRRDNLALLAALDAVRA